MPPLPSPRPNSSAPSRPAEAVLPENLASVRARIRAARERSPRAAPAVDLVVVTKSIAPALFPALAAAGVTDVGENRVQAAVERRPAAPAQWRWHGIGHLQSNKIGKAVAVFDVFHALDSLPLAERVEAFLAGTGRLWPVYIQVNAAADPGKGGVAPEDSLNVVRRILRLPHLRPVGFMTMGRLDADEAETRAAFRRLRGIRDDAVREGLGEEPIGGLSMGMSDDFEWAVEEGATVVRVGRAIFEGVEAGPGAGAPERGRT